MKTLCAVLLFGAVALAQDTGDRVTVPFSDPARPRTVKGSLVNGCFTVEGYDGKDVVVESRGAEISSHHHVPRGAEGLKRIDSPGFGLTVEEENNTVTIHGPAARSGSVLVRVPRDTTVKLSCTNGGDIKLSGVTGDIELNNTNGGVTATNVSGSVIAHSLNGKVLVSLDRVAPDKPMSFSSLNGDVDVTLPAATRATLRMKSDNGEIYSDFEVRLAPNSSNVTVKDARSHGGKYRVKTGQVDGGHHQWRWAGYLVQDDEREHLRAAEEIKEAAPTRSAALARIAELDLEGAFTALRRSSSLRPATPNRGP